MVFDGGLSCGLALCPTSAQRSKVNGFCEVKGDIMHKHAKLVAIVASCVVVCAVWIESRMGLPAGMTLSFPIRLYRMKDAVGTLASPYCLKHPKRFVCTNFESSPCYDPDEHGEASVVCAAGKEISQKCLDARCLDGNAEERCGLVDATRAYNSCETTGEVVPGAPECAEGSDEYRCELVTKTAYTEPGAPSAGVKIGDEGSTDCHRHYQPNLYCD